MKSFHNTPVETMHFLTVLMDLATDEQKEYIAWAIARGNFPVGYKKVSGEPIDIFWLNDK